MHGMETVNALTNFGSKSENAQNINNDPVTFRGIGSRPPLFSLGERKACGHETPYLFTLTA